MSDLEYSAMSQEQLLYVVQDKDAEIERLEASLNNDMFEKMADEIDSLENEIERLRAELNQYRNAGIPATVYERNKELLRDIVKQQAEIKQQQAEIKRLEGDIQILKLQRDATHFSRCPRCNTKPRAEWGSSTDPTALDNDVE